MFNITSLHVFLISLGNESVQAYCSSINTWGKHIFPPNKLQATERADKEEEEAQFAENRSIWKIYRRILQ